MTTDRRRDGARGGRRRATGAAALVAVLVGGACAQEADGPDAAIGGDAGEFAASEQYLAGVAAATEGSSYRMSMDMTMVGEDAGGSFEVGGTFMTGEVDGDRTSMSMDMHELFADMADQFPADEAPPDAFLDADLTMEVVTDGTTGYLRAPYFAALGEMALDAGATRDDLGPLADIATLGDEWGSIDLAEVSPSQVANAAGGQTSDPRVFLDLMAEGTDVHDLGTEAIDGVETRGLGATITFAELLESQGTDVDDFRDDMVPEGVESVPDELDDALDAMLALEIPVQAWIDGDDRVRRVVLEMRMTELVERMAEAAGEQMEEGGLTMTMTMDFTDYGDDTIAIEVPTDAVDVTDEFRALVEDGGPAMGAGPAPFGTT